MGAESTSSVGSGAPAEDCPGDEVLAVHLERELVGDEAERIASHIDGCDACRELVVVLARQMRGDLDNTVVSGSLANHGAIPQHLAIDLTPPSMPGAFAGRYQIKRMIGRGGMGSVFEALDLNLHRLIALKVLRLAPDRSSADRAEAANRLVREARAMAVLSHRNVVAVYDVGIAGDQVFVAMQLVDGATLRLWLAAQQRSPRQVLKVMHDAGLGLAAAHHSRIIHRDLKPDNVLISRRGTARVTDFGLARRADFGPDPIARSSRDTDRGSRPVIVEIDGADSNDVTRTGAVVGTPAYMAPEQARGQIIDARADQFSFCVTTWEALYGQRPYAGTTWSEIYANVINGNLTPPSSEGYVPRQIQRALRKGLAAEPDQRWASMPDLLAEFDDVLKRPGLVKRVVLVAGVALAAAGIAVLVYDQGRKAMKDDAPTAVIKPVAGAVSVSVAVSPEPEPEPEPGNATVPETQTLRSGSHQSSGSGSGSGMRKHHAVAIKDDVPGPQGGSSAPATDPRGDALAADRKALTARWKQRGLLAGDLPADYTDAVRATEVALASGDLDAADAQLAAARGAIDGVVIDYAFVNRKLNRLNERITGLPDDKRDEYATLLQALSSSVKQGDYPAANRKLNEIAARLGFDR